MPAKIPLEPGQRFNRFTVIDPDVGRSPPSEAQRRRGHAWGVRLVLVRCDCGTEKTVPIHHLRSGSIKSCGCWQSEHMREIQQEWVATHGLTNHPLYQTWRMMVNIHLGA